MERVVEIYYDWLLDFVCDDDQRLIYSELLANLYNTEFHWTIDLDENRALWGIALRDEFKDFHYISCRDERILDGPCNMLELMVSLARQIDNVLYNDRFGEQYGRWFWYMVDSLGVRMDDDTFNEGIFNEHMEIFMNREYDNDGKGSLFYIPGCEFACKSVEIWMQKCKFETEFIKNEGL